MLEDKQIQHLLKENLKLSKENNKLLKKLHRANIVGFWSRIIFFLIIVGVPFFIYRYYLEDFVQELFVTYQSLRESASELKELPNRLSF
jgi:hypothetical protein